MKVYLDDMRSPPDKTWTLCKTARQAKELIIFEDVTEISLDHDLGTKETGYDVLLYIEWLVLVKNWKAPKIHIHTANISARKKMELAVKKIRGIK